MRMNEPAVKYDSAINRIFVFTQGARKKGGCK